MRKLLPAPNLTALLALLLSLPLLALLAARHPGQRLSALVREDDLTRQPEVMRHTAQPLQVFAGDLGDILARQAGKD